MRYSLQNSAIWSRQGLSLVPPEWAEVGLWILVQMLASPHTHTHTHYLSDTTMDGALKLNPSVLFCYVEMITLIQQSDSDGCGIRWLKFKSLLLHLLAVTLGELLTLSVSQFSPWVKWGRLHVPQRVIARIKWIHVCKYFVHCFERYRALLGLTSTIISYF